MRDNLSRDESDLDRILDSPSLLHYLESHTPSPAAAVVHSRAEMLHMHCQGVAESLDSCIAELSGKIERRREGIIKDLEGLEDWLGEAYSLVLLEPNRLLYPASLVDEGQLKPPSEGSSVLGEEGEWQRRGSDVSGAFEDVQGVGGDDEEEKEGCGLGENGGVSLEGHGTGDEGGVAEELLKGSGTENDGDEAEEDVEYSVLFKMSASPEEEEKREEREGEEQEGLNDEIVNGKDEVGEDGVNSGGEERVNVAKVNSSDDSDSPTQTATSTSEEGKTSTSEETGKTSTSEETGE